MSWIAGWDRRIKITIDKDKIESDLTDFPVMIYLSSSSGQNNDDVSDVFDELGSYANRKKIAITTAEDMRQCYVEIDYWDHAGEEAWLHVKVPTVVSGTDTELYLYYDSTQTDNDNYVGDTESTPAQTVWDTSFAAVWHMAQDPTGGSGCIKDSTSNTINGTPAGSMTVDDLVDGKVGRALDFDGNDDYINLSNQLTDIPSTDFTIESVIKLPDTLLDTIDHYNVFGSYSSGNGFLVRLSVPTAFGSIVRCTPQVSMSIQDMNTSVNVSGTLYEDEWAVNTVTKDSSYLEAYTNSEHNTEYVLHDQAEGTLDSDNGIDKNIGRIPHAGGAQYFKGLISELRISLVKRPTAWIKATYHTLMDSLLTFNAETVISQDDLDYINKLKLTIPSGLVDSTLYDFPILIHLSSDCSLSSFDARPLFYELEADANKKKIAVSVDGKSECYVEIENWSSASTEAWLWVKLPEISSTNDTVFYLYYDKDKSDNTIFIGTVGSIVAQNVWDDDFVGVWHLRETPTGEDCIKDSTSYENHGTTYNMDSGNIEDVGNLKGLYFNGVDEHISFADVVEHEITGDLTVETMQKIPPTISSTIRTFSCGGNGETEADNVLYSMCRIATNGKLGVFWEYGAGLDQGADYTVSSYISGGNTYLISQTRDASTKEVDHYVDGVFKETVSYANNATGGTATTVGIAAYDANGNPTGYSEVTVAEVRLSNVARSSAWLKATSYTLWDKFFSIEHDETEWLSTYGHRIPRFTRHTQYP